MDQREQASFFIEKLNEKDAEIARLRAEISRAEATIAKLRSAMPSEDALNGAIASVVIVESVSRKTGNPMIEPARDWLTRLEAARKDTKR